MVGEEVLIYSNLCMRTIGGGEGFSSSASDWEMSREVISEAVSEVISKLVSDSKWLQAPGGERRIGLSLKGGETKHGG